MKTLTRMSLIGTLFLGILWSCSKNDHVSTGNLTLKQSLNQSAMQLNTALSKIKSSTAYGVLTEGTAKARPDSRGYPVLHFFSKTADNSHMIVRMPLSKAKNPWALRNWSPADSLLANNFVIDVSDYHNRYNNFHDYDYLLSAAIDTSNMEAGKLNIQSVVNPSSGIHYTSQFVFTGSYTAQYKYSSGDTTVSSFGISGNGKTLYEEKLLTIRNDTVRFGREFQYYLTIGNVQFKRIAGSDSTQVYVDGVLQNHASIKVVDSSTDSEPSVARHRDILVTFDDGTSTTISALIGKSISDIRTLYASLHSVYFAANVVDWIAYDIYYQR